MAREELRVWVISDGTPGPATKKGGSTYARKHVKVSGAFLQS